MINNNDKYNSQFLERCNTDWNLNIEFIHWLNYWMKEFLQKAKINLEFHKFIYKDSELTQKEIINKIIDLTDTVIKKDNCLWDSEEEVDEIFNLFHLVFWCMWW